MKQYALADADMPACGDNQVLIRVKACGFCGTDLHIHKGEFMAKFPLIPGHEFTGVVEKIGRNVKDFKPGDRVVANNWILCGKCYYCKEDKPLYCEQPYAMGVTGPGGFAEYVTVNEEMAFHISDTLKFDEAALTEPTACAIHGIDRIDPQCGDECIAFWRRAHRDHSGAAAEILRCGQRGGGGAYPNEAGSDRGKGDRPDGAD